MDRSVPGVPERLAGIGHPDRRRGVRQKLHTPVYASFNGPESGMVVDLSELLDLHEDGFAVQTGAPLQMNRAVTLCLDLPETKSYVHGSGQVIWSDDAGRGGIRFYGLPENSRRVLKEWLFANLLVACSNHAARAQQRAGREAAAVALPAAWQEQESAVAGPWPLVPLTRGPDESRGTRPASDFGDLSPLFESVRGEIRQIGGDVDAVFQLITNRALDFTGATGAALAFVSGEQMTCRAVAGGPAPPVGVAVDSRQGVTGECVRTGSRVRCDDTAGDSRVDPEVCRALGIGSLMAAPIVADFRVVGLLEIFSPVAHAFSEIHGSVLDRLIELIPGFHQETPPPVPRPRERAVQTETSGSLVTEPASSNRSAPRAPNGVGAAPVDSTSADRRLARGVAEDVKGDVNFEIAPVPEPAAAVLDTSRKRNPNAPSPVNAEMKTEAGQPQRLAQNRWFNLGLLGIAVAVVAMVLGYLFAPLIQKRMLRSDAQATAVQGAVLQNASQSNPASQSAVTKRVTPSLQDLESLAARGDAEAEWQMGVRYHDGEGVPQDDAQAMQWFERAAQQGHVEAQSHLGAYYWAGRGVPEDLSKAYFWSAIALAQGDENSKARLQGLSSQMTRPQVASARQQAELWIQQHTSGKASGN